MGIQPSEFWKMTPVEYAFIQQGYLKAHGANEAEAPTDEDFFARIGAN